MRTTWILLTVSSALVILGLAPAAPAAAAGPKVKNGVIHACLKTKGKKSERGTIHVVSSAKQCKKRKGERPLTWSLAGPAGPEGARGPAGAIGPAGAAGATGPAGAAGASGEAAPQSAVVSELKETIAGQSKEIQTLLGEVGSLGTEVLDLEKDLDTVRTNLEGTIAGVQTNLGAVTGTVADLEPLTGKVTELVNLPGAVTALNGTVTTLGGTVTGLTSTTGTLITSLKATCERVGTVGEGVNTLGTSLLGVANHLTTVNVLSVPILGLGEVPPVPATIPKTTC